ncbi:hypothetical protein NEFER03_1253 [Nematocida sp. LUAm3]|nr:hypothetical protein NEFER03_1253 [Nematocida sp. LUAm3]KAI5174125.1 hypothetical protein NEFER02_0592 [Nematocida sp. LUAm2]KAI5177132.1 hypothetical protein NEFER01_0407 [Nematocida sp. LUAm1]
MQKHDVERVSTEKESLAKHICVDMHNTNTMESQKIVYLEEHHTKANMPMFYKPHNKDLLTFFTFILWNVLLYMLMLISLSLCTIGVDASNESMKLITIEISDANFLANIYALLLAFSLSSPFIESCIVKIRHTVYKATILAKFIKFVMGISLVTIYRIVFKLYIVPSLHPIRLFTDLKKYLYTLYIVVVILAFMITFYNIITRISNHNYIEGETVLSRKNKKTMIYGMAIVLIVITIYSLAAIMYTEVQYRNIMANERINRFLAQYKPKIFIYIP